MDYKLTCNNTVVGKTWETFSVFMIFHLTMNVSHKLFKAALLSMAW